MTDKPNPRDSYREPRLPEERCGNCKWHMGSFCFRGGGMGLVESTGVCDLWEKEDA